MQGALSPPNTSGVPTTTTQVEGALGAQFCAAFNRGVAQNTASWWTAQSVLPELNSEPITRATSTAQL